MGRFKRTLFMGISLVLTLGLLVGSTLAYFTDTAPPLVNTFTPSRVTTDVEETLDGGVKSQVKLQNTGSFNAYLRAAIAVSWQDDRGNVWGEAPVANEDYTLQLDLEEGWALSRDGFYYWLSPVPPASTHPENCSTGVLISACAPLRDGPEGYHLTVQILGSGIQSLPGSVVLENWGSGVASVSADGKLQIRGGL